ncbi:4-hydroxy-3-methylbut-2-enyl diphosphate reductase [Sulfurospirillum sp. 1612]|uniref:4-hydroxy-3-methylbut-2-enyl diphosphate reductase n=1 Tax=Sulfurospirillum sp. 1612 TaxID=3094835 RepID=UPI002F944733
MKVKLAEYYGFCFGVKRAIKIAESSKNASTIGPLIHNNEEIHRLKKDYNVVTLQSLEGLGETQKAIIRTHGIPKQDLKFLESKQIDIVDATCPFVTKPQQICEQMSAEGYDIVIFGDKQHPEVKGVESYAQYGAHVVLSIDELKTLRLTHKIAVVSQTTRKIEEFMKITNYLIAHYKEVRVFNTICNATLDNQVAAKELAKDVDIMIVIGGKNSSNTKQLHYISKEFCDDSYLIESEKELNPQWFKNKKICGVTAGASTPGWIIDKIVGKIEKI